MSAMASRMSSFCFHRAVAVGRPERQRRLDVAADLRLLLGRHQIVARVDRARVLLDGERGVALRVAEDPALPLGDHAIAVLAGGQRVSPLAERALGELHDVALVDERDAFARVAQRVLDGRARQSLRSLARDRLDADAAGLGKPDLRDAHLVLEERDQLARLGGLGRPLDAGVDVLRVLAEDHHVDLLGPLHGTRHAGEPPHRPQAHVEVEHLAERDVEGADAAAHGRRQRSLDPDDELLERGDGVVRQPGAQAIERLLTGIDLHPGNAPATAIGLLHGSVEDHLARAPDVRAGPVTLDERKDRMVGDLEHAAGRADRVARGNGDGRVAGHPVWSNRKPAYGARGCRRSTRYPNTARQPG